MQRWGAIKPLACSCCVYLPPPVGSERWGMGEAAWGGRPRAPGCYDTGAVEEGCRGQVDTPEATTAEKDRTAVVEAGRQVLEDVASSSGGGVASGAPSEPVDCRESKYRYLLRELEQGDPQHSGNKLVTESTGGRAQAGQRRERERHLRRAWDSSVLAFGAWWCGASGILSKPWSCGSSASGGWRSELLLYLSIYPGFSWFLWYPVLNDRGLVPRL